MHHLVYSNNNTTKSSVTKWYCISLTTLEVNIRSTKADVSILDFSQKNKTMEIKWWTWYWVITNRKHTILVCWCDSVVSHLQQFQINKIVNFIGIWQLSLFYIIYYNCYILLFTSLLFFFNYKSEWIKIRYRKNLPRYTFYGNNLGQPFK